MCCFSGNVTFVRSTRIFARITEVGRQAIVYQMEFGAKQELAMILPLPVAKGSDEKAVKFIDLSEYKDLFKDLRSGFPVDRAADGGGDEPFAAAAGGVLKVKQVGAYEASFVPTAKDFERLDPRFRLPAETWTALPVYADHGFAVFKLRAGDGHEAHPMAFTFPSRHPETLFFPTVHIHDGKVHPEEDFDHELYCQVPGTGLPQMARWQESERLALTFSKPGKAAQLIVPNAHVYRRALVGKLKNEDIMLATA